MTDHQLFRGEWCCCKHNDICRCKYNCKSSHYSSHNLRSLNFHIQEGFVITIPHEKDVLPLFSHTDKPNIERNNREIIEDGAEIALINTMEQKYKKKVSYNKYNQTDQE